MNKKQSSGGIGCGWVIQIVLIILKLFDLIDWSWWLVLIPLWLTLAFVALLVITYIVAILSD